MIRGLSRLIAGFMLMLVLVCPDLHAQQDPVFSQYMNNLLTIQPAYAGMTGYVNATLLSRIQWVGFDGAPVTSTLTVNGPMKRYNIGVGFSLINDKAGPVRQLGMYGDYSFRILIDNDQYVSFGIKGGFNRYEALLTELGIHDENDPVTAFDINKKYLPNFGVGVMWHADNFFIGLSCPKIFTNKINSESGANIYMEVRNYYAMGGVVLGLADNVKFKPTFLARWSQNTPTIVDLSANLLFFERVWVGATYRLQNSYGLLFQAFVNKSLKLGYAYDLTTFQPMQFNAGTHEIMVSYDFPYKKRRYCRFTPRYF